MPHAATILRKRQNEQPRSARGKLLWPGAEKVPGKPYYSTPISRRGVGKRVLCPAGYDPRIVDRCQKWARYGFSKPRIAARVGVSLQYVQVAIGPILDQLPKVPKAANRFGSYRGVPPERVEQWARLYREEGWSGTRIAKAEGVLPVFVYEVLRRNNVPIRPKGRPPGEKKP